ncbi:MAG TPA: tetratricopeptide repeat protein [Chthoniobacteraceae bacterium]
MRAPLDQMILDATERHRAGLLAEAESIYREILAEAPDHFEALHFLGILAGQVGRLELAVELMQRAATINSRDAELQVNLGLALERVARDDEAMAAYLEAKALRPEWALAFSRVGHLYRKCGRIAEAIGAFRKAVQLDPHSADARCDLADCHFQLGNVGLNSGQLDSAIAAYEEALRLRPEFADALNNLGCALAKKGAAADAVEKLRAALRLNPNDPQTWMNLGSSLLDCGRIDDGLTAHRKAIRIDPGHAEAHANLGRALLEAERLDEAEIVLRKAIELNPSSASAENNLGNCYKARGEITKALARFRKAVELDPSDAAIHSNLAFSLCYEADPGEAVAEAHEWSRRHGKPLTGAIRPHGNDPSPDRRLRIGYVSPDFRDHVVAGCLRPLMRGHDRGQFEVYCYSNVMRSDAITKEFRQWADVWRNLVGSSDEAAAEMIRADGIDILVDLALHTSGNRLPLFARKPAPVQMSWLGYCGTTGLEEIDYRLSDPYMDPPEADMRGYSEQTVRLPACYWCYEPAGPTPEVSARAATENGGFTFGCLNNFAKVSPEALDTWSEILRRTPGARFLLHAPEGSCRRRVYERMAQAEVNSDRLEFVGRQNWNGYVQSLSRIDLALDPFPYGGGVSTCDALWMGTPVVGLAGLAPVGRGALSILRNLGLAELVAETPRDYVEIATKLARDRVCLEAHRSTLRVRMERSPLRDVRAYGQAVEVIYRKAWYDWCGRPDS